MKDAKRNRAELLAPAGNLEKLKMAVHYGADAVFLAGKEYGLRAFAGNFSAEEMREGVEFAHDRGAKVYVTVNIFAHSSDLSGLPDYLKQLEETEVDGLIISDPGILAISQEIISRNNISLHLSTQANTTNWASAAFWERQGIHRIVLAREMSLTEIKEIRNRVKLDLEVFVHGALCISYSGRCLLSNYMTGRDANRGECAQPCRWNYALMEEKRPGSYYPVFEDERGSYVFNSQDLCLIEHLPELIEAGVNALKIEGRMKSAYYVATIVHAYRLALDAYYADPANYRFDPKWFEEICKVSHRDYTTGFLFGRPLADDHNYQTSNYLRSYDFVGLIQEYDQKSGWALVEQRNRFGIGDILEITGPQTRTFTQELMEMTDADGFALETAPHPQQLVRLKLSHPAEPWDMIRRAKNE